MGDKSINGRRSGIWDQDVQEGIGNSWKSRIRDQDLQENMNGNFKSCIWDQYLPENMKRNFGNSQFTELKNGKLFLCSIKGT